MSLTTRLERHYDKENRRLVYVGEGASPDFWNSHWETENLRESMERGKDSRFVLKTLRKYIPDRKGRVLEGGCADEERVTLLKKCWLLKRIDCYNGIRLGYG